jgi:hypothetical protein
MAEERPALAIVLAPRRQIVRDFRANSGPILVALAAMAVYVVLSSLVISAMEEWSILHAAYFTVINVTTVGFGDVTATTHLGKVLSGVNAFAGLIAFGVLVALITVAFQPGEFTGTASPVERASSRPKSPDGAHSDESSGALAVADVFESLGRLLRTPRDTKKGRVRIAVHSHRDDPHIFVEIFVRSSHEA